MNTKTKTTAPSAAEKSQQRLEVATAVLAGRHAELQQIHDAIEELQDAWACGDDSTPATRMQELKSEDDRLTLLVAAAESEHRGAHRSLRAADPVLGEAIAHAIGETFYGIRPEAVTETPHLDEEVTTPRLYVVQTKPHTELGDGMVGGSCSIVLVAPAWAKGLNDGIDFARVLREANVVFKGDIIPSHDRVDLVVDMCWPEIPMMPAPEAESSTSYNSHLSTLIKRKTTSPTTGLPLVAASGDAGKLVKVDVDGDVRTALIDVSVTIGNASAGMYDTNATNDQAKRVMLALVGKVMGQAGRVVDAEIVSVVPAQDSLTGPRFDVTARYTVMSKVRS